MHRCETSSEARVVMRQPTSYFILIIEHRNQLQYVFAKSRNRHHIFSSQAL